jgi:hypothetical protein
MAGGEMEHDEECRCEDCFAKLWRIIEELTEQVVAYERRLALYPMSR